MPLLLVECSLGLFEFALGGTATCRFPFNNLAQFREVTLARKLHECLPQDIARPGEFSPVYRLLNLASMRLDQPRFRHLSQRAVFFRHSFWQVRNQFGDRLQFVESSL